MNSVDIISRKRNGYELSYDELSYFINGFTTGDIPDYQAAAWLMAVLWQGMTQQETTDLTLIMAESGETLDLSSIAPVTVDKHSTGGVGDKTTLVVAPLIAAAGRPIAKMSGRGLGFSGGTLDKLESIPGYDVSLSKKAFLKQVHEIGVVVAGQTGNLVPADGKLYALRDVTATVDSIPLIASSIMSKKIAAGAQAIVLDVKLGQGSFMRTATEATELSETMVAIGKGVGRQVVAVISDMNQPLGNAVGNTLEVLEAIDTLQGKGPADFTEHCMIIASHLLILGKKANSENEARSHLRSLIRNGAAIDRFRRWIGAQNGDVRIVDSPSIMPQANFVREVSSARDGFIAGINAREVGLTALMLGAGREKKGDEIDHGVGIVFGPKVGDKVKAGNHLFTLHISSEALFEQAAARILGAYEWSNQAPHIPPLLHSVIT